MAFHAQSGAAYADISAPVELLDTDSEFVGQYEVEVKNVSGVGALVALSPGSGTPQEFPVLVGQSLKFKATGRVVITIKALKNNAQVSDSVTDCWALATGEN